MAILMKGNRALGKGVDSLLEFVDQQPPAFWVFPVAVLLAMATGRLIAGGLGLVALGVVCLALVYSYVIADWRRGLYGLLLYLPFGSLVTLALFPWQGGVVLKDFFFVIPMYLAFYGRQLLRRDRFQKPPRLPGILMIGLGGIVVLQMANPGVENLLMALIGAKVWLFYLPLYVVSFCMISSDREWTFVLRFMAVLTVIPCVVGLAVVVLIGLYGYRETMEVIYGLQAPQYTQNFTMFSIGGGFLPRIPSTFAFVTQYFGFTLAMIVPCSALWRFDSSTIWRRVGGFVLLITVLASFLSGSRAAFVFVPLLLTLILLLERGFAGILRAAPYLLGTLLVALSILRIGFVGLFEHISELVVRYTGEYAIDAIGNAIVATPIGTGTGTNTGPARYAFTDPDLFIRVESYYAKAIYELGVLGFLIVLGLFISVILEGYRSHQRISDPRLRACSAALLAFLIIVALNSFKGWQIDLDPINVYFWLFSGFLLKLPYLARHPAEHPAQPFGVER